MRRQLNDIYATVSAVHPEPEDDQAEPSRKRRRTIAEAFQSIVKISENRENRETRINQGENKINNDLVQDEFMIDAEDDVDENDGGQEPLSPRVKAEREIMRSLVFGGGSNIQASGSVPQLERQQKLHDPVERKLQELIRKSIEKAIQQSSSAPSECDMEVETTCSAPSPDAVTAVWNPSFARTGRGRTHDLGLDDFASQDNTAPAMDISPL